MSISKPEKDFLEALQNAGRPCRGLRLGPGKGNTFYVELFEWAYGASQPMRILSRVRGVAADAVVNAVKRMCRLSKVAKKGGGYGLPIFRLKQQGERGETWTALRSNGTVQRSGDPLVLSA